MKNFFTDVVAGDLVALTLLFLVTAPIGLLIFAIAWVFRQPARSVKSGLASGTDNSEESLKRLSGLRAEGVISRAEYDTLTAEALSLEPPIRKNSAWLPIIAVTLAAAGLATASVLFLKNEERSDSGASTEAPPEAPTDLNTLCWGERLRQSAIDSGRASVDDFQPTPACVQWAAEKDLDEPLTDVADDAASSSDSMSADAERVLVWTANDQAAFATFGSARQAFEGAIIQQLSDEVVGRASIDLYNALIDLPRMPVPLPTSALYNGWLSAAIASADETSEGYLQSDQTRMYAGLSKWTSVEAAYTRWWDALGEL